MPIENPTLLNRWLLLLHQIPPQPAYFRARILRQLTQLGALPIKKSAYLLPATDDTLEDLQWLRREIVDSGGEAWLFECTTVAGHTPATLRDAFCRLRAADYHELLAEIRPLLDDIRAESPAAAANPDFQTRARRLSRKFSAIRKIDFFKAHDAQEAIALMKTIEHLISTETNSLGAPHAAPNPYHGRRWVTRRGVKIDRIASAWLIARFIDPAPEFVFVDAVNYTPASSDLRFDMFDGEFTHEDGRCTFETLVAKFSLADERLKNIAAIVHDIDLKENRYDRPETPGIAAVIDGIIARFPDDPTRIEEGRRLFDSLYEHPS